jgi:hypothetical protein
MQESHPPVSGPADAKRAPLHDDIAQCARDLWIQNGQPADCDQVIWLEAEQRLLFAAATQAAREKTSSPASSLGLPLAEPAAASDRSTMQADDPALPAASLPGFAESSVLMSLGSGATPGSSAV